MQYKVDRTAGPPITKPPIPRDDRYGQDDKKSGGYPHGNATMFLDGRLLREVIFGSERAFNQALILVDGIFDLAPGPGRALYLEKVIFITNRAANLDMRSQYQIWADGKFLTAGFNMGETIPIRIYIAPETNVRFFYHITSAIGNTWSTVSLDWVEFAAHSDSFDWGRGVNGINPPLGAPPVPWP